jgi:hypothetical protein
MICMGNPSRSFFPKDHSMPYTMCIEEAISVIEVPFTTTLAMIEIRACSLILNGPGFKENK